MLNYQRLSSYLATSWVSNHRCISIPGKTGTNTSHQPPYESGCWGSSQLWAQIGEPKVGCPWWTDSRQKPISPKMRKLHIQGQRLDWQWRTITLQPVCNLNPKQYSKPYSMIQESKKHVIHKIFQTNPKVILKYIKVIHHDHHLMKTIPAWNPLPIAA